MTRTHRYFFKTELDVRLGQTNLPHSSHKCHQISYVTVAVDHAREVPAAEVGTPGWKGSPTIAEVAPNRFRKPAAWRVRRPIPVQSRDLNTRSSTYKRSPQRWQ